MSNVKVAAILFCSNDGSVKSPVNLRLLKNIDKFAIKKAAEEIVAARFNEVIIVIGHEKYLIEPVLKGLRLKIVYNKFYERGLHASIKAAIMNLSLENDFFALCFADQPIISRKDYNKLIAKAKLARDSLIICPTHDGMRSNPIIYSKLLIPEILDHEDTALGCSYLFERHASNIHFVEMQNEAFHVGFDQ